MTVPLPAISRAKLEAKLTDRNQEQIDLQKVGRAPIATEYKISCLRCGVLMAWSHTPGDPIPESNLVRIHERFSKHSNPLKLHLLRFTKKKVEPESES